MSHENIACLITSDGDPVHLQGITLTGDLRGLLFEAQVEQRFINNEKENVEIVYTFPLPARAVLMGVDVKLGDQSLTGTVIEKHQAEAEYEETLSDGNAAIMLERNHDHSYSLNLGNLAAGEQCTITLRYAQTLTFSGNGLRLLIPTVIAPRYGNPITEGGLRPHQVPEHQIDADYPFDITLRLHGNLAQGRIASPSHPVAMSYGMTEQGPALTVSLARGARLDRDFILSIEQLVEQSMAIATPDMVQPSKTILLASFCPHLSGVKSRDAAVKILVDCSGSMAGDSIQAARRALQSIVMQFKAGEHFALSRFGSTVIHRSRGLWKMTDATRLSAQTWVSQLDADLGGTEMEEALSSTFALGKGTASDVLLITDGEIHDIDEIIAEARKSDHRLFVIGIGSSPAETHLRRLAEATQGACDFVAPGEDIEPAVLRMFARLRSPHVSEPRLQWPDGAMPLWHTPLLSSIFDGDTINVFAELAHLPRGDVRLLGKYGQDAKEQEIARLRLPERTTTSEVLSRMAAYSRQQWEDEESSTATALDYQLVTEYTNFLLLHTRDDKDKASSMPELRKIPQMHPAGWGGYGVVLYSRAPVLFSLADHCMAAPPDVTCNEPLVFYEEDPARGITPQELANWLHGTPRSQWPGTYEELHALGLEQQVIDWLQHLAQENATPYDESTMVQAFLHLIAWPAKAHLRKVLEPDVQRQQEPLCHDPVIVHLMRLMQSDLAGLQSQKWQIQSVA